MLIRLTCATKTACHLLVRLQLEFRAIRALYLPDLQGNNLKVGGAYPRFRGLSVPSPNPWKREGAKSFEKRRDTKGLCGIGALRNPYSAFRSDHLETRESSTCYVQIMSRMERTAHKLAELLFSSYFQ